MPGSSQPKPPRVRLYTRPGCSLCAEVHRALAPHVRAGRLELEEVDLSGDADLEKRYGDSVPVLEHAGRPFAKGRFDSAAALERLERRLAR